MIDMKTKAKKLKLDLPAIFIALKKKETPILAKLFAGITIGYALSPIDLMPDFIPVLGLLDDIILLPVLISLTIKLIPSKILEECKLESENLWNNGKPRKWYFSIPIILIWTAVLILSVRIFLQSI